MRNFLLLIFMLSAYLGTAQIKISLSDDGNSYYEGCNATFINRSANSPNEGKYLNDEDYYVTICPSNHDLSKKVTVDFNQFDLETGYDFLEIYDDNRSQAVPDGGSVANYLLLGTYTGNQSPGRVTSTRGCLTFHFTSDGSVVDNGWKARVSCGTSSPGYCNVTEIDCGKNYTGNTQYGTNNQERYSCGSGTWRGRELVYRINTTKRGNIKATLTTSSSLDLDIFILEDCTSNCVARNVNPAGSSTSIVRYNNAPAGDYYIVIDGQYSNTYGAFNLLVECDDQNGGGNGNCLVSDNFESYYSADNVSYIHPAVWRKWNSSAPDGKVSRDRSFSGSNAMEINRNQYGAQDVVLKLGNRSNGIYKVSWKMYINSGDEAYFNIQRSSNSLKSGGEFGVKFESHEQNYQRRWFDVELFVDLNRNRVKLYIDNRRVLVINRNYTANLGGINFYATSDAHYYVDDICMKEVSAIPFTNDEDSASSRSSSSETISLIATDVPLKESKTIKAISQALIVFPNPTKGIATLTLALIQPEAINISIFTQTGQMVKQLTLGEQTQINQAINLSDLSNGMYILKAHGTTTNLSQKVLVQH